jgi:hypothetical protein
LITAEELYGYREAILRLTNELIFDAIGRDTLNLYSGAVLVGIKRVLIIFRAKK